MGSLRCGRNDSRNIRQAIGYENLNNKVYQQCTRCQSRAFSLTKKRVISNATTEREGRGSNDSDCQACGYHLEEQYTISRVRESTSSSHSSTSYASSGSSSSDSSSSSWGGGSSGGGGSGSDW